LGWALLSALTVFVIWEMRDRSRLIRDNDNERILNMIFTGFRWLDDIDAVIEENPVLLERLTGFGIYGANLAASSRWGNAPGVFDEALLDGVRAKRFGRYTIPVFKGRRVIFVIRADKMMPPPPPHPSQEKRAREHGPEKGGGFRQGDGWKDNAYLYIDITHHAWWRTRTITTILFPLIELALLALVLYIRHLYIRNREYRERIDSQKNLVVLGTAASTLAHEIKNPLLSIRLQTGILQKLGSSGSEEIFRINEEVDRISALVYRVNDYLREAPGNRIPLNVYSVLSDVSERLCGRNIIRADSARDGMIFADADRICSVFENLIRNALESGGPAENVDVVIKRSQNREIDIAINDRGKGIGEDNLKRVFDPFFTSKSTGTGIGLTISKRFVEAIEGSIVLENREGGGMAVHVTIPELNSDTI
jgi:two-component system sensor histidine kinase HydH